VSSLILMLVVGAALLAWMLVALLRGVPQALPAATFGRLAEVVPLPGLSFACPERLFDSADYAAVRASGSSTMLVHAVRAERRRLALLWLRLLRQDVHTLWRLRRTMAAYGASAGAIGELRLALAGTAAIGLIQLLRLAVVVAGPFQAASFCRASRNCVDAIWRACAGLWNRIPAEQAGAFERAWAAAIPSSPAALLR
jgi:hypothetical protein